MTPPDSQKPVPPPAVEQETVKGERHPAECLSLKGAKSDGGSGSSQTIKEPSDRNALNLQMALEALRALRSAISDFKGHGIPGFTDRAVAYLVLDKADDALKCLSSHAPESSSGSEFSLQDAYNKGVDDGRKFERELWEVASSPSSPLPEGEEDSAPKAQPQSERTKDTTGQTEQL